MAEAFIYDAIRTPRGKGKRGGALYEVKPIDLVTNLLEALKSRHDLDTSKVEDLILACGEPVKEQGQNIAKAALVYSTWDDSTTGAQLHRYCAGGLDAVNLAAAKVAAGYEDLVAAGGVESMSRLGIGASGGATGDPWVAMKSYFISQGLGADMIATMDGFSREDVDRYAVMSQQRAAHAREQGYFKSIIPVKDFNGVTILDHDEFIRADTSMAALAKLKPAFQMFNDYGHGGVARLKYPQLENIECVHTPGNSSGIVDGAGLVLVGSERAGKEQNLQPRARILSCALVGTEPTLMLNGPAPATQKALQKAGLTVDDIDLFELNEAFASVVLRYQRVLGIPDEKINVNGGAIAMGHPIGATGAMILGTLLDELERRNLKRGVVTLCAGGGIGIATIIERV
ncbi:acetyl-CoA acetyltransferase [gamma proteobacterium BDW918]|jgi:acetyl-CoA C-acetyltransferase|uniref:Acetyl-CoA acetyltransferase n=1 Tax=Zhongshania aliphaticivorans TaxID=1470434 RepID=A0A127M6H2_9GAMM|nr:acetyl-CoA C-acetyltransferase [Zhongshania aliphaticivorans]AMO68816.1 acetyl-CoA acetyltransferase [Zhongshania aliphaticivorans]EIF43552.1 acetyl-CoA acetyltransferase [gamma proteobacterium BDW918]|tara:strand:+ start:11297 stop:12496 length:1200 start_codon:yes stop_codon:yes gene_type:complete